MFNLTVAEARTFFVGDGAWLVHNCELNTKYSNVSSRQQTMFPDVGESAGNGISNPGELANVPGFGRDWNWKPVSDSTRDTLGILEIPGKGKVYLRSAAEGPSQLLPTGIPGFHGGIKSHVEAHAVAIMRLEGIKDATLFINNAPCRMGGKGCHYQLPRMVPNGNTFANYAAKG